MQTNSSNGQLTAQVNLGNHQKSGFDLSNNVLGTGKIGRIIPTRALHVMPNDTIKADSKVAVQFEPLAVPILANMDVRQEHFYVPYNVVWQNWDKFISGGEKLNYHGYVPNVSMYNIVKAVYNTFTNSVGSPISIQLTQIESRSFAIDAQAMQTTEVFENMRKSLDYVGDKYYIKDLLKPQYAAIDKLSELVFAMSGTVDLFHRVLVENIDEVNNAIAYYANGNKYLKRIAPALLASAISNAIYVPTTDCLNILKVMYEYYKPFFGIGSNIDYLNMSRISFTDFVYISTQEVASHQDSQSFSFTIDGSGVSVQPMSILHLRANYNVWYNNYRDILLESNAMEPIDIDTVSEDELFVLLIPRQRCWEKDAFTTALDNPGTGNVGVPLSLQGSLTDPMNNIEMYQYQIKKYNIIESLEDGDLTPNQDNIVEVKFGDDTWKIPTSYLSGINNIANSGNPINPNIGEVQGFSLHALDAAQRAQKWLQKALFYGNRISDFYYMHFGVRFLDARLRLPELLTSSKELVKLDVIMNDTNITTEANGQVYQSVAGDRAAYASAYDNGNGYDRYCEEHGVILSYLTIMPQATYAYGMNRDYSRLDQFDFAFGEFATLGMDAVYSSELTHTSVDLPDAYDIQIFGYQGKYYDYKAKHSEEHGELLDSQDMYTFSRFFNMYDPASRPKLNYEFVHCFPDLDMFVVDDEFSDYFRYDIRHSTAAERNLPSQSIYI